MAKKAKKAAKKAPRPQRAAFPFGMHVVFVGGILGGFDLYGPFKTGTEAEDWACENVHGHWEAMPLKAKESYADV